MYVYIRLHDFVWVLGQVFLFRICMFINKALIHDYNRMMIRESTHTKSWGVKKCEANQKQHI